MNIPVILRARARFPIAVLAGALVMLAFAPFCWWPIQLISLALLFYPISRETSAKQAFLLVWAYGFGWSVGGVYWLFIAMHRFGDMPAWLSALGVGLMGLLLGVFPALTLGCAIWIKQRRAISVGVTLLALLPAAWALGEWLRGWVMTGLPWVVSGYAHANSPLAGYAPVLGVYGVGWLAALSAAGIAAFPLRKSAPLLALGIFAIGLGLKTVHWTDKSGQAISVRLLQGNVSQDIKFVFGHVKDSLFLYHDMIIEQPADLIATPETAIPLLAHQLPSDYLPSLARFSKDTNSYLAIGIPLNDGPEMYTNSIIGLSPTPGGLRYRYDKHHLVPFGEFIPSGFRWFVNMMNIPLSDFTRGAEVQAPFAVKDQWILPNICYEDLFGEEIAAQLADSHFKGKPAATILLNVSNLAWYGESSAIPQHFQISQMRALETGRTVLRSTNDGATAIIDPQGRVVAQLAPHTRGTLAAKVDGYVGNTPYILCGNILFLILTGLSLLIGWFLHINHRITLQNPLKSQPDFSECRIYATCPGKAIICARHGILRGSWIFSPGNW